MNRIAQLGGALRADSEPEARWSACLLSGGDCDCSPVHIFAAPGIVAHQAPLSVGAHSRWHGQLTFDGGTKTILWRENVSPEAPCL